MRLSKSALNLILQIINCNFPGNPNISKTYFDRLLFSGQSFCLCHTCNRKISNEKTHQKMTKNM